MKENKNAKFTNPRDLLIQGCERPWEAAVEPFKVAPHVYYVGNSWVGAYLIEKSEGFILSNGWPISMRDEFLNGLLKVRNMKVDIAIGSHPNQTNMLEQVDKITDTFNPFYEETVWGKFIDGRIEMIKKIMETSKLRN